jgi:hypothetical protein
MLHARSKTSCLVKGRRVEYEFQLTAIGPFELVAFIWFSAGTLFSLEPSIRLFSPSYLVLSADVGRRCLQLVHMCQLDSPTRVPASDQYNQPFSGETQA